MKKIFQNLLLSFISLIIFILLAEGVTRLLWKQDKEVADIRKGLILEGANRSVIYEGIEYNINSYGIRNKELSVQKDSNIIRIMALGDSYVWGDGLSNDDLITVKLESILNKKTNKNFEVINTGKGGYNTQDEYEQLLRLYSVYNPDIVIQFFFTNDILSTDEDNLVTDSKVKFNMWLRKNSAFYSFLYYLIKGSINSHVSFPKFLLPKDYFNLDDTKLGWVNFKNYTKEIKNFCDLKGIDFYFVFIPTLTNLNENYPYIEIKEKVAEFIHSIQVPFLSYFSLFSKNKPVELWVSESNTHWNGFTTSLAAEELASFIINSKSW